MMSRKHTRLIIVLLAAFLAVLSPLAVAPLHRAAAQTNPTLIELTGTITAMGAGTITVNAKLIDISTAQIRGVLAVGKLAKVQGTLLATGMVKAREVRVETRARRARTEIVGTLQSWTGTTMVVDGQSYDVTGAQTGRGMRVGASVKLHLSLVADQWRVREVMVATAADLRGDDDNGNDNNANDNDDNANMNDNDDNNNANDNDDDHSGKGGGGDDESGKGGGGKGRGDKGDD